MQGGVLHLRRRRVERVRVQDGALLLEGQGQARQGQDHRAQHRLPRRDAPGDERHRHGALLEDVRAAGARLRPHPDLLSVSSGGRQARRDRGADRGAAARGGDPARGAGHGGRLHRRAHPRRRRRASTPPTTTSRWCGRSATSTRCSSSPTRSSPASAGPASGSRMEHWNVLPDIISFAKGVSSGYLPLGGIMVSKAIKEAMDDGEARGQVDARLHLLRASDLLRGGPQEPRDHGARAALGARGRHGHAAPQGAPRGASTTTRTSATSAAARGCSPPSSWSRTRRPRRRSTRTRRSARACLQEMTKRGRDHARAHGEHLLLAAAGHHRGAARPDGLGHPRRHQGRHRRRKEPSSSSPSPLRGEGGVRGG